VIVGLLSFKRDHYLKKCLSALEGCYRADEFNYVFFQDGAVTRSGTRKCSDKKIEKNLDLLRDFEYDAGIHISEYNRGIAEQIQRLKDYVLIERDEESILVLENDIIPTKYFLEVSQNLYSQFPQFICSCGPKRPAQVGANDPSGVVVTKGKAVRGLVVGKDHHLKTRDGVQEYLDFIGDDYASRNHGAIRQRFPDVTHSSYDAIMASFCKKQNIGFAHTCLPRAAYVGKTGLHQRESAYNRKGWPDQYKNIYEDPSDVGRAFKIVGDNR